MERIVKSFNTGYPFIDLDVFINYIFYHNSTPLQCDENKTTWKYHMRLLLIFGSMSGIKMSQLIQLTWSDLILFENFHLKTIKSRLIFGRFDIPLVKDIRIEFSKHAFACMPRYNDYVFTNDNGEPLNQRNLSRDVRKALKEWGFPFYNEFKTESTQIMFGRAVIKIHGYNKRVMKELKSHLNFHSELQLLKFLNIDSPDEKLRRNFHENLLTGL